MTDAIIILGLLYITALVGLLLLGNPLTQNEIVRYIIASASAIIAAEEAKRAAKKAGEGD